MIAIGCSTGHTLVDGCCLTLSRCCLVASADEECAGEIRRREEEEEALAAEWIGGHHNSNYPILFLWENSWNCVVGVSPFLLSLPNSWNYYGVSPSPLPSWVYLTITTSTMYVLRAKDQKKLWACNCYLNVPMTVGNEYLVWLLLCWWFAGDDGWTCCLFRLPVTNTVNSQMKIEFSGGSIKIIKKSNFSAKSWAPPCSFFAV